MHSAEYGIFVKKLLWDVAFCAGVEGEGWREGWIEGRRPARRRRAPAAEPPGFGGAKTGCGPIGAGGCGLQKTESREAAGFGVFRRNLPILGEKLRVLDESCGNFYLCKGVTALPFFAQFSNNTQKRACIFLYFIRLFIFFLQIPSCFSW